MGVGGVGEWVGVSGGGGDQYKEILCKVFPMKFYEGISL